MSNHEWKVVLAALGISNKAPVIEIPGHAIVAADGKLVLLALAAVGEGIFTH